jgi:hypothetical protein
MINMGMSERNHRAFVLAPLCVFFLTACGDLGMVLPSQGSYRVNAQVDDDYTLDVYSVVTKNSKIRPYFVNSVVNDPDVRGLTVFVQDYSGAIASRKVHYLLDEDARAAQKPAEQPELPVEIPPETPAPAASGAETGPEGASDEAPRIEPSGDETAMSGGTGNDPSADAPASSEETPPKPPDPGFEEPPAAVETATEAPADISGGTAGAWASAADAVEPDTAYAAGTNAVEPDTAYAAGTNAVEPDTAYAAGTNAVEPGTAYAAGTNAVEPDTRSAEAADTSVVDTNDRDTDGVGTNIVDTNAQDTADTDAADTDVADTDATGADAAGAGTGAVDTDIADTDAAGIAGTNTVDTDAIDTNTAESDSVNTDAVNTDTAETEIADADAANTGPALPAAPPTETPRPPIPEDETIMVRQLDQSFPAFQIVEGLNIGRYNLVFQVMGEKEILHRTLRPIYFIGDAKFTLGEIQSFLPVAITGGRLIPPGINVMLGTEIKADSQLDPYIIWHNGKKILAQGRLSAGANYLLWKTPEQTGFHSIRAEVFPLLPGDRMPGNMIGKIKELSLPVSSKSERVRRFSDPSGEFINWYQFWGTLDDANAPNSFERRLVSLRSQTPRWIPFGGMYGLLVGHNDVYTLPGMPFKLAGDAQGTGRILFCLAAFSEGGILNIRFAGGEASTQAGAQETEDSPVGTAELDLSFTGDALILRIASDDASQEESLELNGDQANGFITLVVEFTIAQDYFDAELRLGDPAATTGPLSIALAAPISGEGVVRFGEHTYSRGAKRQVPAKTAKYGGGTMALNELALSYKSVPFPPKEENLESGVSESLIAEEEEPGAEPESSSPDAL